MCFARLLVAILSLSLPFWAWGNTCPGVTQLEVESVRPKPNYKASSWRPSPDVLVDGSFSNRIALSDATTIGWASRMTVRIDLRITLPSTGSACEGGSLKIHSLKRTRGGMRHPRFVSAYLQMDKSRYVHVGSASFAEDFGADNKGQWLEVPVSSLGKKMVVFVHAQRDFFFADELEFVTRRIARTGHSASTSPEFLKDPAADSRSRLRAVIAAKYREADHSSVPLRRRSALHWWEEDPWGRLSGSIEESPNRRRIEVSGLLGETEVLCFGLLSDPDQSLTWSVAGLPAALVTFSEVKRILTAYDGYVFDPIVSFGDSVYPEASSPAVRYLWVQLSLSGIEPGEHRFSLVANLGEGTDPVEIPVVLNVINQRVEDGRPDAFVWSYPTDFPIWNDPVLALGDLRSHGVTAIGIPPKMIPGARLDGRWDRIREDRLLEFLSMRSPTDTLIFFTAWDRFNRKLRGNSAFEKVLTADIRDWLERFTALLESSGVNYSQWYLYPIDEVRGKDLEVLDKIVTAVKSIEPRIQIYANPGSSERSPTKRAALEKIAPKIDLWQPGLLYASGVGYEFFESLDSEWWIYANPSPAHSAKAANPLKSYRLLGWNAFALGADGVGFWSYSDTEGSSAWDDFDGIRPDWAVVYEGENRITSSRRWEAFREGLEDYSALSLAHSLNSRHVEQLVSVLRRNPRAITTTRELKAIRDKVLADLSGRGPQ